MKLEILAEALVANFCPPLFRLGSEGNKMDLSRCRHRPIFFAAVLAMISNLARAGEQTEAANPYSRGTGKLVTGISIIPAGIGVAYAIYGFSGLKHPDEDKATPEDLREYGRELDRTADVAQGIAAVSTVSGIILIVSGINDRRLWRSWNESHIRVEGRDDRGAGAQEAGFSVALVDRRLGLAWSWRF